MSTTPPSPEPAPLVAEHDALPLGTRFGEFEILRVVGVGGFGIVYLAQDHSLERQVALKEYMPAALAARGNGSQITVRSAAFAETYAVGLRSFVNEARLLARFDHPSLVKVYRFWEDNGTAYMVMPFLRGMTLRDARRAMARAPDEAWIRSVIEPLLGALDALHREGVYHRDIAPDNILLPPEGAPILLDFGAARHVISDRTQSLTAILKPNYAPIEQYAEMTAMRQGPWTDIYALGAVMHFLLFGVPPPPATARAMQPDGEPIAQRVMPGVSPRFMALVGWTLGVRPLERPQNIAALREALNGQASIPEPPHDPVLTPASHAVPTVSAAKPPDAPTAFAPTQRIAPTPVDMRTDPAEEPTRVPVSPLPAAVAAPSPAAPAPWRDPVPSAPPAGKKGLVLAGLGLAFVVAAVVLWQFVGLLGNARGPAIAQAGAASAAPATASAPAAPRVIQEPPAAAVAAVVPPPAASAAASAAVPAARGLPSEGRPVPLVVPAPPAPVTAPATNTAALGASAPARVRPGKPVPNREEQPAAPSDAPLNTADAPPAREPGAAARPAPTFTANGPRTATEFCGRRVFLALAICMDRECERPIFRGQPDCRKVLETKRQREQQ